MYNFVNLFYLCIVMEYCLLMLIFLGCKLHVFASVLNT